MSYLETTKDVYREAAETPDVGLCCTTTPIWDLPGLDMPKIMLEMNYGCRSTVHPRDLVHDPKILYVGVGGGTITRLSVSLVQLLIPIDTIHNTIKKGLFCKEDIK